jgi:5-methylcytosine-specific restriction endonuclease McrBC GTP-binding regulatory subunit McrB
MTKFAECLFTIYLELPKEERYGKITQEISDISVQKPQQGHRKIPTDFSVGIFLCPLQMRFLQISENQ